MNRGKLVIIAILLVAVGLAGFAWWNRWSRSQVVIAHWGPDAPAIIRTGKVVELLKLDPVVEPGSSADSVLTVGGVARRIADLRDISSAPGLIHARHQLVQNEAFHWDQPRDPDCQPEWTTALRFQQGNQQTTVVFDFRCRRAVLLDTETEADMSPIAEAMESFLNSVATDVAP